MWCNQRAAKVASNLLRASLSLTLVPSFLRDEETMSHLLDGCWAKIERVGTAAVQLIDALHKLLIIVTSVMSMGDTLEVAGGVSPDGQNTEIISLGTPPEHLGLRPSENGTEVFRIGFGKYYHPEFHAKLNFILHIGFEEFGTRKNEAIIPSLVHLRDAVVETIKLFEGQF
jgi:hypothetical protein